MPTFMRISEILSCFMAGFLPYMLLLIYPFRNRTRLKSFLAGFLTLVLTAAQLYLDLQLSLGTLTLELPLLLLQSGAFLLFALLVINAPIGKVLLNTFSVINFSILIHTAAQFSGIYTLRALVMTLVLQAVVLIPYSINLVKYLVPTMNTSDAPVWNFLWIIPALVTAAGCILLYLNVAASVLITVLAIATILAALAAALVLYLTRTEMKKMILTKKKPNNQIPTTPAPAAQAPNLKHQYYINLQTRMAEAAQNYKDLLAQVVALGDHLDNREFEQLRERIALLKKQLSAAKCNTGNSEIDPVLAYFIRQAQLADIKIVANVSLPEECEVSNAELSVLISALMDNALDGCRGQVSGTRRIAAATYLDGGELQLGIKYTHSAAPDENCAYLQICRQIVQSHGGKLEVTGIEGVSQIVAMMKI